MQIIWLYIVLGLVSARTPSSAVMTERIEAKVGNRIITSTDLDLMVARMRQKTSATEKTIQQEALSFLIDQKLIELFLKQTSLSVTSRELDKQIDTIRASNGAATIEDFRAMIQAQGLSFDAFKQQLRQQLQRSKFYSIIKRQTLMTITDNDMKAYFAENKKDFENNYEIELAECLIPTRGNADETREVAKRYVKNPTKFGECVEKHSQAPSAANRGRLGAFTEDSLREDVARRVFPLNQNEVVIIELPGAIQLLKVLKKKDLGPISFEDAKPDIRAALEEQIVQKEVQKTLRQLKTTTAIKIAS